MSTCRRRDSGFTIVELICSLGIGSILLLVSLGLLEAAGSGCGLLGGGISGEREGRAVMTRITDDLRTVIDSTAMCVKKPADGLPGHQLAFLMLQPVRAQSEDGCNGDLCTAIYYLKDLLVDGKTVRCLMRGVHESHQTWEALKCGQAMTSVQGSQSDEPLACGVASFEVRPVIRDHAGRWIEWNATVRDAPAAVEVRMAVARPEFAAKWVQAEDWDLAARAADQKGLMIFRRLIPCGDENR